MKNKKIIQLNQSQLIDLICETILEISDINEAIEDKDNPMETGEHGTENHYLDKTPDKGFKAFWYDWNDKNMSDEDFSKKHKKTKEQFKEDIKDEIDSASNDARDYYKSYYSKNNPDVYKKLIDKEATPSNKRNDQMNELKRQNALNYIHMMLDKIADGGWSFTHNGHKGGTNIWYNCEEMKAKGIPNWTCSPWGWVSNNVTGRYAYNMNVFRFTNPTLSGWREKIYGTTVHEIGHLLDRILEDLGIRAYKYQSHHSGLGMPDEDGERNYIDKEWETYARIHQLRRVFDVTSNISAKEWANLFMDRVKSGDITFKMDGIDEETNKVKKECGKKFSYTQEGTGLLVADANDIQQFLKDRKYDIATDADFGDNTAKAVGDYLSITIKNVDFNNNTSISPIEDEKGLRNFMKSTYPIFKDGIGAQAQGIIADLLYKKCKEIKEKEWIPPVRFELASSGKRVIMILSKQLLTQQYSGSHGNADGVPDTFNNIWSITSDIRYNGRAYSDIAALFAKFSFDVGNFTYTGGDEDDVYVIIDFEKIEEVNDIFVAEDLEYEFDDFGLDSDSTKT